MAREKFCLTSLFGLTYNNSSLKGTEGNILNEADLLGSEHT
jgi:hypothetical protein